ncbi:hypothetical protein [Sandarakinorhabdus rubra]|uniref:hypothetical protein n=1 Tax=Sandarakinorhabdus rubra TaxID=2672568 RepID=UPI0013D8E93C|nr:hypothetical protein [Sandarakinorhabdus rubra]
MPPVESLLVLSTATLAGLAMLGGLAAWSWAGWLKLKTRELDVRPAGAELPAVGQRIDLADLKERIRKLEAIAAGVDL